MRYTDIHHDVLPTGRLRTWVATDDTLARAHQVPGDPRRTSHNQEGHLARALARRLDPTLRGEIDDPTGAGTKAAPTGWLAVRFDVAPAGTHALRRAFEDWVDRHETLRSGFRAHETDRGASDVERFTLPAGAVELRVVDHGDHHDPHVLADLLEDRFNAATDAIGWPTYTFAAITSERTTTLLLAFNHLNVDGYSMLLMAGELRELIDADREGRPSNLPRVPSYVDFVEAEREVAAHAVATHAAVERWDRFLGPDRDVPTFPLPDGLVPGSQIPQGSCWLPLLSETDAATFSRWCRANGVSAGVGFLGTLVCACIGRLAELEPDRAGADSRHLRVLVSTHTRHQPHWAKALGWFTAVAPLEVTLSPDEDLRDALTTVDTAWAEAKVGAGLPLARVSELLGRPIDPRFVISYLDARQVDGADRWQDWRAHAYFGDVGPTDEVYAWINRMPTQTYLTWRHPDNDVCAHEVRAVTDRMGQIIRRVLTTAPTSTPTGIAPSLMQQTHPMPSPCERDG